MAEEALSPKGAVVEHNEEEGEGVVEPQKRERKPKKKKRRKGKKAVVEEFCELCNVMYPNELMKSAHLTGKRHEKALRLQTRMQQMKNRETDISDNKGSVKENSSVSSGHVFSDAEDAEENVQGHVGDKENEFSIPNEPIRQEVITYEMNGMHRCDTCEIFSTSLESHNRHLQSERHAQKLKEPGPALSQGDSVSVSSARTKDLESKDDIDQKSVSFTDDATESEHHDVSGGLDLGNAVRADLQQLVFEQNNLYRSPSSSVMAVKDFDSTSRTSEMLDIEDDLPPLEFPSSRNRRRGTSFDLEQSFSKAPEPGMSRIVFIGTGWSTSTPVPDCILSNITSPDRPSCSVCHSAYTQPLKSRNKRGNTSILIQYCHPDGERMRNIQLDVGKTFRENALRWYPRNRVSSIDSIILSHDHADAMLGLDDIRGFQNRGKQIPISVYCSDKTFDRVKQVFPYLITEEIETPQENTHTTEYIPEENPQVENLENGDVFNHENGAEEKVYNDSHAESISTEGKHEEILEDVDVDQEEVAQGEEVDTTQAETETVEAQEETSETETGEAVEVDTEVTETESKVAEAETEANQEVDQVDAGQSDISGQEPNGNVNEEVEEQTEIVLERTLSDIEETHVTRVVSAIEWHPTLKNMTSCEISGLPILTFPVMHGEDYETFGFEFGQQERVIYLPDVSRIPQSTSDFLRSRPIDLLILDCIFRTVPHPTHFSWKESLDCVKELQPKRTFFVGMSHEFDHFSTNKVLYDLFRTNKVQLAHDGLTVNVML